MFRWHYVKYDDGGKWECGATGDLPTGDWVDCFCQLDMATIEYVVLQYDPNDQMFYNDDCCPCKVFRWCYVDDIVRALNDITRAFMQSETVKKETDGDEQ